MTAATELKSKIQQVEKSLSLTPTAELNTKMALTMKSKLKAYQDAYNLLVVDNDEKKNEIQKQSTSPEQRAGEQRVIIQSNNGIINSDIHTSFDIVENSERVEDEKYFFISESSAKEYNIYRNRLRSRLHYWNGKKDKKKKDAKAKEELNVICSFYIARINFIIETQCKEQYISIMKNKKYSLGNKEDSKKYCFNIEKLKKDFSF